MSGSRKWGREYVVRENVELSVVKEKRSWSKLELSLEWDWENCLWIAKGCCCIPSHKGLKPRFYSVKKASWAVCMRAWVYVCVYGGSKWGERGQYKRDKGKANTGRCHGYRKWAWFGVGLCTSVAAVPFISDLKIKDESSKVWHGSKEISTWASLSFPLCVCLCVCVCFPYLNGSCLRQVQRVF